LANTLANVSFIQPIMSLKPHLIR